MCVCVCVCVIEPLDCTTSLISWEYVFITYGVKNLVASSIRGEGVVVNYMLA